MGCPSPSHSNSSPAPLPPTPCPALSPPRPWPLPRTPHGTPLHPALPSTRQPGPSGRPRPLTAPYSRMGTSCPPTTYAICLSTCSCSAPHQSPASTVRQRPLAAGSGAAGAGPLLGYDSCPGTALFGAGTRQQPSAHGPGLGCGVGPTERQTLSAALPLATLTSCHLLPLCLSLCSFICPICLFSSQVQTFDKSVSPLCLSLSSFLLALWAVAPPHLGFLSPWLPSSPLIYLPIYPSPSTQPGPGLALPTLPSPLPTWTNSREGLPCCPPPA